MFSLHSAEYAVTELPQIFSALHEKHIFELSILNSSFPALRRCFAASVKRSRSKRTLFAPVYNLHSAAHGTITSRGAELGSRKTKPLHLRQRTHVASLAPARSFRGYRGIETPMFLVLLTPKEQRPSYSISKMLLFSSLCSLISMYPRTSSAAFSGSTTVGAFGLTFFA